jgi:hypothetical protein
MNGPRGSDKPELGPVPKAHATPKEVKEKDEWEPVEGRKHLYRSRITGKMEYRPPEPPVLFPPFYYP